MFNHNNKKENSASFIDATPLLFAVFVISICGIIYELIIGAISSYLLGDSVKQYSLTIGLFMSAMGIGSYISKRFKKNLFDIFVTVELSIGILGGISALVLFSAYSITEIYYFIMYITIIIIGILVGLEIPILTRIIEESKNNLRITIANVLSFDYIGGLIGSLAFPLLLLPNLGEIKTSFLVGLINIAVANLIIYKYSMFLKYKNALKATALLAALLIFLGFLTGDFTANAIEQRLYRDQIIYSKQTQYQKMVVTRHKDDIRLFLNGNIQFSSSDEYRYHEALIHPAMSLSPEHKEILILGGGDGMAAREILKYDDVKNITLVDLDPDVIKFCSTNPIIKRLNNNSLINNKMNIINDDAYKYLENSDKVFDVIIVDLPDPNNEGLNKLYTNIFYRLVGNHLKPDGIVSIQSTSPYYAKEAYWCINKTINSEDLNAIAYHIQVPSFGNWGFNLASHKKIDTSKINLEVPTKYLDYDSTQSMFVFGKDEANIYDTVKINSLTNPILLQYYQKAWDSY